MAIDRRHLLLGSLTGAAAFATPAAAAPLSVAGLDATHFGVRPGAANDQSTRLQRAVNAAAQKRVPLWVPPGVYRAGNIVLPAGAHLVGVREQTRFLLAQGHSLLSAEQAEAISLTGIMLDGGNKPLPDNRGLLHLVDVRKLRITDCTILRAGGDGISLDRCDGVVTQTSISGAADNALFSNDSRGLVITANLIRGAGNGGIRIWQREKRHDASIIADNQIEDIAARSGGTGENGNAINVYRAANVTVRNNVIRKAAFSAIRGNTASGIQIIGNNCAGLDEVAIYSEFAFESAVIADNVIDETGSGISVTNFREGGRLATVQGNIVRNCRVRIPGTPPEGAGVGIGVEADTAVTGNVVENAAYAGISAGWGKYLRDVVVSGNVVRTSGIGIAVSVVAGTGTAVVAGNQIARVRRGAIVGMEWHKVVTGDLALAGAERYPHLRISGNQVN